MNRIESRQTRLWLAAGLLAAAVLTGCAQDVGTIDRTQHNIVRKADILGKEFYYRTTVLTTPFSSAYSTIGDQGRLERGIFEVQEDYLHFYRTYEWKEGAEHFGAKSDTDTPLLDENGEQVTYDACVDRAGRIWALENCDAHGGTVQKVPVWVFRGAPLASFPVESHFDMIYTYNPATGERTNVKVEDTADRQWFEREFMRVHWGNGEVLNYSRLMLMGLRMEYPDTVDMLPWVEPTAEVDNKSASLLKGFTIYKGEADQPRYQPHQKLRTVGDDPEETTLEYMDFVSHWVLPAPTIFYEDWNENVPLCWFYPWYAGGIFECSTEELAVRSAFLEVPKDDRYASVDYDDNMLEKFGYYRAERQYYDRIWDSTYNGQIQKAFLHPIWQAGRDAAGKLIPMADRTPQPIVYYLSEAYPRELVDESVELAHQWSEPFESVAKHYKGEQWWNGVEGLTAENASMFLLCENSNAEAQAALDAGATFFAPGETPGPKVSAVAWHGIEDQEGFHPLCKDMADTKFNGDLRYNQLHAVIPPLMNGLLGFGPPSADPLTGRIVSANAYNYIGTMHEYADSTMDVIETMAGVRNVSEYTSGRYIKEDQKVKRAAIETNDPDLTTAEAVALAGAMVTPAVHERVATLGIEKTDVNWAQARLSVIHANPGLERMLVDDSVRMLFRDPTVGLNGGGLDAATIARMSPANWGHADGFRRSLTFKLAAAERGIDLLGFSDPAIGGYVEEYRQKYDAAICAHFADKTDYVFDYGKFADVKADPDAPTGRCAAEGERDADGWTCTFVDQGAFQGNYWVNTCTTAKLMEQLRERISDDENLDPYAYWGPDALFVDSRDPVISATQLEMKRKLAELRDEYVAEIYQQMYLAISTHEVGHNLGLRHNFAGSTDAMNYPREYWELKAGVVPGSGGQTFAGGVYKPSTDAYLWQRETKTQQYRNLRQLQTSSIMDYGAKFNSEFEGVGHYDQAAVKFGYGNLVETFRTVPPKLDDFYAQGYLRSPREGAPSNYGLEYKGADKMEELFKRVHYTQIPNAFGDDDSAIAAMYDRVNVEWQNLTDAQQEVPYRFCEGDRVGADPWCWTRDSGADAFEIVTNEMDDHESYDWYVYGYGHDSTLFWPDNYYNRVRSSFFIGKIHYQWWALNYSFFNHNDWWATVGPGKGKGEGGAGLPWHMDKNGGLAMTLAAGAAYDEIAGAFGRPIEGNFGYNVRTHRYEVVQDYNLEGLTNQFRVYEDDGARPMYASWSNEGYDVYPIAAGAIYDRMAAFEMLTDPTSWFFGVDDAADTTRYRVSFYTMFPEPMLKLLGGLMTGEVEGYGWCVPLDEWNQPMQKNGHYLLRQRSVLNEAACGEDEVPLDPEGDYTFPTTKYRIPMLAAYYGMSLMITDYDRSFMDVSRIFLQGHESAVEVPEGVEVAKFEHPFTGKIYVAYKSGLEGEYTPAWYLIQEANAALEQYRRNDGTIDVGKLAAEYERGKLEFATGKLELVRAMHELYDYSQEGAQAQGGTGY